MFDILVYLIKKYPIKNKQNIEYVEFLFFL